MHQKCELLHFNICAAGKNRMTIHCFLFTNFVDIISYLQVLFDMSLARGLDYYTGVIYETILDGKLEIDLFLMVLICPIYRMVVFKLLFSA